MSHMSEIHDEADVLASLVPLAQAHQLIEVGCGGARLAQGLLQRLPHLQWLGLEVDTAQHTKNLARLTQQAPALQARMRFALASAEAIPATNGSFDGALMLKSLHHVPLSLMDAALAELWRVLRPGGWFYASEPVYEGALNDIVKRYNDEGTVRAAAQAALDRAVASGQWTQVAEQHFDMPAHFNDWPDFEARMLYPSFADHAITPALSQSVQAAFAPHCTEQGAHFTRPMHVRLLKKA